MRHLLLDLYDCDVERLADEAHLRAVLAALPDRLHMQAVSPVYLAHIDQVSEPQDAGHSGFVIIATSHCSLHAWPGYGMLNADVFSCETFDADAVASWLVEQFRAGDREQRVIERALGSPRLSNRNKPAYQPDVLRHSLTGHRVRLMGGLLPPLL
jgi:S-adenosylmethionine decarboxylase